MKILFVILSFIIVLNGSEKKDITIQLSWKNQFQFAGYYVAKELGYYKDLGLNVKILEYETSNNSIEQIEKGEIDFAIGRSSLLIEKANNKEIIALGAIFQHSPLILLTRDEDIKSLSDLKNRNVMITSDAKNSASIIAMLNANGVELSDLNIQKHSSNINDLIEKRTDAMASYISNEPLLLEDKKVKFKIFNPKEFGFDFYDDILYSSSKFVNNNPNTTKDFYDATIRGWQYAFRHIPFSAKLIYKKYNTQNKTLKNLINEAEVLKNYAFDNIAHIGYLKKERLSKINDVYKLMGMVTKDINLDEFVYEGNNCKVVKFEFINMNLYFYILIFCILVIFIGYVIIYFFLKKRWLVTNSTLKDEIKNKTEELEKISLTDPLTKIKNRKAYDEKISELLNEYKRYEKVFSMVLIDLDDFKKINDQFGHKKGDEVLISFCRLVETHLRSNDHFFRVGGEEFILLLPNIKVENSLKVCEKLLFNTKKSLILSESRKLTLSMGLVEVKSCDTETTLYERVDTLLYKSKNSGKDRVTF